MIPLVFQGFLNDSDRSVYIGDTLRRQGETRWTMLVVTSAEPDSSFQVDVPELKAADEKVMHSRWCGDSSKNSGCMMSGTGLASSRPMTSR